MAVVECVTSSGIEASRLAAAAPYAPGLRAHRHSWVEAGMYAQGRGLDSPHRFNFEELFKYTKICIK